MITFVALRWKCLKMLVFSIRIFGFECPCLVWCVPDQSSSDVIFIKHSVEMQSAFRYRHFLIQSRIRGKGGSMFLKWIFYFFKLFYFHGRPNPNIVKLLAKSKLKSLPYNHTDHLPTTTPNFKLSLYKSIQVLHQHMRYH